MAEDKGNEKTIERKIMETVNLIVVFLFIVILGLGVLVYAIYRLFPEIFSPR
ncbi:hypothetical protein GTO27_05790 [Candidatus Bathyarchaeota archaeon]|nr:hypothetical protein [Candidatus Bathyarchaeota archaeon]